mgnify:CR=1 FL=1
MKAETIKLQDEYIKLLETECARMGSFFVTRPYMAASKKDIDKGQELRDKIEASKKDKK